MKERTPHDGRPYYCDECGLGIGEWMACEFIDCRLESEAEAKARQVARPASRKVVRQTPEREGS